MTNLFELYRIYDSASEEQKNQLKRTYGGALSEPVEAIFNLGASTLIDTPYVPPTSGVAFLSEENQKYMSDFQKEPEGLEQARKQKKQASQYLLQDIYEAVVDEENVEMRQQGEYMSPTIIRPEGTGPKIVRELAGLGAAIIGVNKVTAPIKTFDKFKKTGALLKAEAAGQLAINPFQDNLANIIGEWIPDDSWFSSFEEYILEPVKYDKDDTELEARIKMGGESILAVLGITGVVKLVGGTYRIGKEQIGKIDTSGIKVPDAFMEVLKDLKGQSAEVKKAFVDQIKTSYNNSIKNRKSNKIKESLIERRKRAEQRGDVQKGTADTEALEGGWFNSLNSKYFENDVMRTVAERLRVTFAPRQGVPIKMHERYLKMQGLQEKQFTEIAHIIRNIDTSFGSTIERLFEKIPTVGRSKERDKIFKQIDNILYTDRRFPAIKTSKGFQPSVKQTEEFNRQLKLLPEELREPVKTLRQYQDSLSRKLSMLPDMDPTKAEEIIDNLGFYVRKSYKLREAGKWYPSGSLEKAARIDIKKQYLEQTTTGKELNRRLTAPQQAGETLAQYKIRVSSAQKELDTAIDTIIEGLAKAEKGKDYFSLMGVKSKYSNKGLNNLLKERLKMPTSVQKFLGRIDDPLDKFEISATKTARRLEEQKFYNDIHEQGRGLYIFKDLNTAPSGFKVQIKEGYGKLSGMYTNDANARFIQNVDEISLFIGQGSAAKWLRAGGLIKSLMHAVNTIYSHGTQFVNVVGAGIGALANGNNPFSKEFAKGLELLVKRGAKTTDKQIQKELAEAAEYNLFGKNILASEYTQGIKEFTKGRKGKTWQMLDTLYRFTGAKYLNETFTTAYRSGDELFKLGMWKQETKFFNKINDLLPEDPKFNKYRIENTKQEASDVVSSVLQNYDFLPRGIKKLRGLPFISTFFSFSAESIRMAANTIRRTFQEIKLGREMIKDGATEAGQLMMRRGIRRGAAFGAVGYLAEGGYDRLTKDEREIEAKEHYNVGLAPDYQKDTNFSIYVDDKGYPHVNATTRYNPYNFPIYFVRRIGKYLTDDDPLKLNPSQDTVKVVEDTILDGAGPFIDRSLLTNATSGHFSFSESGQGYQVKEGSTEPTLIANPFDPTQKFDTRGNYISNAVLNTNNLTILLARLAEAHMPGTIKAVKRYRDRTERKSEIDTDPASPTFGKRLTPYKEEINLTNEKIKFWTGWSDIKLTTEYLEAQYAMTARTFQKRQRAIKNKLATAYYGGQSPEDFERLAIELNEEYYEYARLFAQQTAAITWYTKNYKTINASPVKVLREKVGLSLEEALKLAQVGDQGSVTGIEFFTPLKLTQGDLQKFVDSENKLYSEEQKESPYRAFINVNEKIYKEMSAIPLFVHGDEESRNDPRILNFDPDVFEKLREKYKRDQNFDGGEIFQKEPVPNVVEEPSERINPFTGEPYEEQMERLGFVGGGALRIILKEASKKASKGAAKLEKDEEQIIKNIQGPKTKTVPTDKTDTELDEIFGPLNLGPEKRAEIKSQLKKTKGEPLPKALETELGISAKNLAEGKISYDDFRKVSQKDMQLYSGPVTKIPELPKLEEVASVLPDSKLKSGISELNKTFKSGEKVSLRLDIPSYKNYNTWIMTVHKPKADKVLGYGRAAKINNVQFFNKNPSAALYTAVGGGKTPSAAMDGSWVKQSEKSVRDEAVQIIKGGKTTKYTEEQLKNNQVKDWIQISYNPRRASFFYDKKFGLPIESSDEVIQVGNVVLAKNPKIGKPTEISLTADVAKALNRKFKTDQFKKGQRITFAKGGTARNYRKEYDNYHSSDKQKKDRAHRNNANRKLKREGRIAKGDGRDVDHKDGNPRNNSPSNLTVKKKESNRSFSRRLSARNGGDATELKKDQRQYVEFYNMAVEAGIDYPEIVAAQASLESSHGTSDLTTKYNNPFGIKVLREAEVAANQPSVQMNTKEVIDGKEIVSEEPFRVYDNIGESFEGYKEKVAHPRYDAIREATTKEEYARAIQDGGYASDPDYADKLINIAKRYQPFIK